MKSVLKFYLFSMVALLSSGMLKAQQFDDMYKSSNASMVLIHSGKRNVYVIKNTTVILLEDDNQLNISVPLYDSTLNKSGMIAPGGITPVLLNVSIDINPKTIQGNLTSSRQFVTRGNLIVNKINKPVEVSYIPMASGTEEQGNFKMFITIQFDPSDFKLIQPSPDARCVIQISDAPVNRE